MRIRTYFFVIMSLLSAWMIYSYINVDGTFANGFVRTIVNELGIPQLDVDGSFALAPDTTNEVGIPQQAIRLRILANSDQVQDQWLKRKVRDEIVKEMATWVHQPKTIQEARVAVRAHLTRFQQIAVQTMAKYGYTYPVKVKFGQVPFPTKLYGDRVYPAGNYEALLITLGAGKGGNWWCVLFPPLCFIDMSNGDAVPKGQDGGFTVSGDPSNQAYAAAKKHVQPAHVKRKTVEVRFLLLDELMKLWR